MLYSNLLRSVGETTCLSLSCCPTAPLGSPDHLRFVIRPHHTCFMPSLEQSVLIYAQHWMLPCFCSLGLKVWKKSPESTAPFHAFHTDAKSWHDIGTNWEQEKDIPVPKSCFFRSWQNISSFILQSSFYSCWLCHRVYDRHISAGCGYRQLSPFENGLLALRCGLKWMLACVD